MKAFFSYAIVLSLGLAVGFIVKGPLNLEDVANIKWLDEITVILNKASVPAKPAADVLPIDPAAAALIDEELDYRIAQRLASLEGWRSFLAAHGSGAYAQAARAEVERRLGVATDASAEASAATPTLAPADNEHDYGPSHQLGSVAPYAQPATAKVQRLPLAEKAPGSGAAEASTGASSETRAASEPTSPVSSPSDDVIPPIAAAAVSPDASQDTKPADEPARPAAPPAGADVAAGTQLAALTPEEVCLRDANRLTRLVTRLRVNPSRDEAQRFANELGCEELRPQLLGLIAVLPPAPAAPDTSSAASPGAEAENETAHPAAPLARADVAPQASDETCKRDEDRIVRLRLSPSVDETQRFANELGCEKLRPQLQRLMESLDTAASAPRAPEDWSHSNPLLGQTCASERSALDRLRQEPSAEAAGLFWRDLKCARLRPQVRLLLESLNVTPDSVGSAATPGEPEARGAAPDPPTAIGGGSRRLPAGNGGT